MSASQRAQFEAAIDAVKATPDNEDAWDEIESLAGKLDSPDAVAAAYRDVLDRDLSPELAVTLGQRAARFCEEWYGEDPTRLVEVLERVLALDPESQWAFQKLTVGFTVSERWDELFALYDRSLAALGDDDARRAELLEEAYQSAKDLANAPDRAIEYLKALLPLAPGKKLADQLERLLEKHERWQDLIELWESRIHEMSRDEAAEVRMRIATIWFENLRRPDKALETLQLALPDCDNDAPACALLERIITHRDTPSAARSAALTLLRGRYESTDRQREIVRVLEQAMPLVDSEEQKRLRREMGKRLGDLEDHGAAMDHYAAALILDPSTQAAQRSLRQLAQASDNFERYAQVLTEAAQNADAQRKVALLVDAARTRLDLLEDEPGAIALFASALNEEEISRADVLTVGRRLNELLARADRSRERLDVLERLAAAESVTSSRRALIGDVARLAEDLGEVDRALAAWKRRLDDDATDAAALDAIIELLTVECRWPQLIAALRQRVEQTAVPTQKRADLIRIARVQEEELEDIEQALAAWRTVRDDFGEDVETVDALSRLYAQTEKWQELADLLERASARQTETLGERLVTLGAAYREHLRAPEQAASCFLRALNVDPRDERALAGAVALLQNTATRGIAAEALGRSYRETSNWPGFLDLVEPRLEDASTNDQRLYILREAAEIQEKHGGDMRAALGYLARAFPLAPKDRILEDNMVRLADATGQWQLAIEAYRAAADAVAGDPPTLAGLRLREAGILERNIDDQVAALKSYFAVIKHAPDNRDAASAVVRLGARQGKWAEVATAMFVHLRATSRIDDDLFKQVEQIAIETGATDDMIRFLSSAIDQGGVPSDTIAAELHWRVARWQLDLRNSPKHAVQALTRVVELDDRRSDAVRALVDLQRDNPGPDYFASLRRLCDLEPNKLDVWAEAAEVAVAHSGDDDKLAAVTALYGRAAAAWRKTGSVTGERDPRQLVEWSIEQLVDLNRAAGRSQQSLDLLVEASRLPFDERTRRKMRQRAAQIADQELRDTGAAIEMYRALLAQSPDDAEAIARLAAIYQREDRLAELLALRRHELALSPPAERRLTLRLELADLIGEIDRRGGRMEVLRANLEEQPGHDASIDALSEVLVARARHGELVDLLWDQARRVEKLGQTVRAAKLWAMAARIAQVQAGDPARAIEAYRRVVTLSPTAESLDALSQLYMEADRPADAVPWLEARFASASSGERSDIVLRLARAHIGAGDPDAATACLERAVADRVAAVEPRMLLASLYRDAERWEPLARLLTDTLPSMAGDDRMLDLAREAAEIYAVRLNAPAKAIPALEKALAVAPDEREMRVMMARGLRVAGRLDDARAILDGLVAEYGRRRSPERAAIHVELAQVARAQNKLDDALSELELASRMDETSAHIQKMVAEAARDSGKLDKAERSLRALLLLVRREPPGDDESAVGVSEILYELSDIAKERGDTDKAAELLESALEAAGQSDAEARRLRRTAVARGDAESAVRALRSRLDVTEQPVTKAQLLADIGGVLAHGLHRPAEAMDALLGAIALAPGRLDIHDAAVALAREQGSVKLYLDAASDVAYRLRREEEGALAARLLMRLGAVAVEELRDLARARELFGAAEKHDETRVDALFAVARVCGTMGEFEDQTRALDELTRIALADGPSAAQAGALYRLAEVEVQSPDLIDRGLELLRRALDAEPRYQQAATILMAASDRAPDSEAVLEIYERVARSANDPRLLLDFLERRARHFSATPAQVKEAVDLAVELGEPERGEALLQRAVEAARSSGDGVASVAWAVLGLTERKLRADELESARDLLFEAADIDDAVRIEALGLELASRGAASTRTLGLAADVYEFLRGRRPGAREIWEPLFAVYRELGDAGRLQELVSGTLPSLLETGDRNALRLRHADFLSSTGRTSDAVEILRDALLDDPDDIEAGAKLESVLVSRGDDEGLADFLWQRFEDAKERRNPETVADVAVRLAGLLDRVGTGDPVAVCRDALAIAPDSVELLRATISRLDADADPGERAHLMERLLNVETEDAAPPLALALAEIYASLNDSDGAQRALEVGHRTAPTEASLKGALETWYRERAQWANLARLIARDAGHKQTTAEQVVRFREAARVFRDELGDLISTADVLRKARAADPRDPQLVAELASCLVAAGDTAGAVLAIGEALSGGELPPAGRVDLLLLRSDLRTNLGHDDRALEDLEEAYALESGQGAAAAGRRARAAANRSAGKRRHRCRAQGDGASGQLARGAGR